MKKMDFKTRCQYIQRIGCLACLKRNLNNYNVDVHHLNVGGHAGHKRRGNEFTIGLCVWHHRGQSNFSNTILVLGPSLKHEPNRFREVFGSDDELLTMQNELIEKKRKLLVGNWIGED